MIEIDDKVISLEIFSKKFVCDLNACKGACCIEGDSGAPITAEEVSVLEEDLEKIKPFMRPEGIAAVEETGVFYMDWDNEMVTTLVNEKECAFVFFDEKGITKCAIEQAHKAGVTDFKKPISCHLYPIRTAKFPEFEALNYNEWSICSPACTLGEALSVKVYQFLKEPLIRAYGEAFYKELEEVDAEIESQNIK
ncbi:MAG: DUF3109 family protein [Crocinitomicaceae bacterium]|nr:DUF3109 family protein [Crocinitomicaceae bacterium]